MQLHEVFLIVENPSAYAQIKASNILNRPFCDQIGIQFRPDLGDHAAQFGAIAFGLQCVDLFAAPGAGQIPGQDVLIYLGFQDQTGAHHDGLNVVVEQDRDQSVLKAGHNNRFVDERVF